MRQEELSKILQEASGRGIYVRGQEAALQGKVIIFNNKEGQTITALGNAIFPVTGTSYQNDTIENLPAKARRLPPAEQKKLLRTGEQKLMDDLEAYRVQAKISPANWNVINVKGKAALVSLWKNDKNKVVAFVRFYPMKTMGSVPMIWSNSDFARDTGYAAQNVAQQRTELNLKPFRVVGTSESFELDDLLERISENMKTRNDLPLEVVTQVPELLKNVRAGFEQPVANAAVYQSSYEIDLGEVAAPIALVTGHFVSGSYKEVEKQLLAPMGTNWSGIQSISFPMAGNEQLVDSYLHIDENTKLSISSKDRSGGAAASIASIVSILERNPERYEDMREQRKFKYLFNILKLLKDESAVDGPLKLSVKYGIIDQTDLDEIKLATKDPHLLKKQVSKKLQKLLVDPIYTPNTKNLNYTIGFHLLAVTTHKLVAKLNESEKIISDFFKQILARSNTIQVKTYTKVQGDSLRYSNFTVIWPAVFDGKIKFESGTRYTATTSPNGKIGFKIGK